MKKLSMTKNILKKGNTDTGNVGISFSHLLIVFLTSPPVFFPLDTAKRSTQNVNKSKMVKQ